MTTLNMIDSLLASIAGMNIKTNINLEEIGMGAATIMAALIMGFLAACVRGCARGGIENPQPNRAPEPDHQEQAHVL